MRDRRRRRLAGRAARARQRPHRLAALDNRLGAYVALEAARRVAEAGDATVDVVAVAAVQEEQRHDGAARPPSRARARRRARDRRHVRDRRARRRSRRAGKIELGSGAAITRGPIVNRHVFELLVRAAEEEEIPHAIEVFTRRTDTDADDVHSRAAASRPGSSRSRCATCTRPCELASLDDLEAVIRLVVAFARRLTPETSFLR